MDQNKSSLKQANYILRYLRNEITPAEKLELERWIERSQANRKIFDEAVNESLRKEEIEILEKVNVEQGWDELILKVNNSGKVIPIRNHKRWWFAVAAAVVIMGVFSLYKFNDQNKKIENNLVVNSAAANDIAPGGNRAILQLADGSTIILDSSNNGNIASQGQTKIIKIDGQLAYNADGSSKEILYNTISTPRGGQYQLILADGTKVWLNAASSLRFPTNFTGKERRVTLTGEGYFEVAKNANMPFKVDVAGKGEVEVLGTHFNVNAYADEANIKTTLLEGKVKANFANQSLELFPNQQSLFKYESNSLKIKKDVDVNKVTAWKNGLFDFDDDDITIIMRQLARWYDVQIQYNGKISEQHFTGGIRRQVSLSQVLQMLKQAGGVDFKVINNKIEVNTN